MFLHSVAKIISYFSDYVLPMEKIRNITDRFELESLSAEMLLLLSTQYS